MRSTSLPRQQNVQQQNAEIERLIRSEAGHWRKAGVPAPLRAVGEAKGVDWARSIVVSMDIDFPGMPRLFGLCVTQEEKFVRFALDTDDQHQVLESVEEWVDVTDRQNFDLHNPGFGAGFGALALKVLRGLDDVRRPAEKPDTL